MAKHGKGNVVSLEEAKANAAAAISRLDAVQYLAARLDRWVNPLTGLGSVADKTKQAYFEAPFRLTDGEITNLASGNDLAAKIIEKRPNEMFRRGYDLDSAKGGELDKSQLEDLEEYAEERLKASIRLHQAMKFGRQYGGSLLIMGINDGREPWEPVDERNIESIAFLNQVDRRFSYVQSYYSNYMSPNYGEPQTYLIANAVATSGLRDLDGDYRMKLTKRLPAGKNRYTRAPTEKKNGYTILNVHESRVIRFGGVETDVLTRQVLAGWDWSVLQRIYEPLRQTDTSFDALCYLISDASQGVLKLKGLFQAISSGNEAKISARMQALEQTRAVNRSIALDAGGEEDFERVLTPLTGIPDSIDRMMQRLAAAADMPLTELFGLSPAGLSATGESDRIKWYDTIANEQQTYLKPRILRLLRLIALAKDSPFKGRDISLDVRFKPLYAPTDKETAETSYIKAQTDAIYVTNEIISPEQVQLTLVDRYSNIDPEEIEAAIEAKTKFDPYEKDPIASDEAQAGAKAAEQAAKIAKLQGQSTNLGEGQTPTVPLAGSAIRSATTLAGEGKGTPSDPGGGNPKKRTGDKKDPGPNVAKAVYKQLLKDFPAAAISWVLAAQWEGPKEVDLSRIDWSSEDKWRAARNPKKVEEYTKNLDKLAPVILADVRGTDLLEPIDGHHRLLAYKALGMPPVAYVFSAQTRTGPWTDLHTMVQKGGGGYLSGSGAGNEARGSRSRDPAGNPGSRTDEAHKPFMLLPGWDKKPEGAAPPGFSCANCSYLLPMTDGTFSCGNSDYQDWADMQELEDPETKKPLLDPSRACSDWFKPKGRGDGGPGPLGRKDETHEHWAGEFEGAPNPNGSSASGSTAYPGHTHLFTEHEKRLPREVHQPAKDQKSLYESAKKGFEDQLDLLDRGKGVAKDLGATLIRGDKMKYEDVIKKIGETKGPIVSIGPMKFLARATEKVNAEYKGDWSKLGDVVRANVAVDTMKEVPKVMASLRAHGIELARQPKDRFAHPTEAGYRDAMFNVRYPSGHIGELQIHLKPMLLAKEIGGHQLYEKTRTIEAKAKVENRGLTPDELKIVRETNEQAKAHYGAAWEKSRGDSRFDDWDESKHPREANGQFGEGGGDVAGHLAAKALKSGGFSFRPSTPTPTKGYMVSLPTSAGVNHVIDLRALAGHTSKAALHAAVKTGIKAWLDKAGPVVSSAPEHYLGGWVQKDEHGNPVAIHLDVSQRHETREGAISAGRERNQLAVWDIEKGEEIATGGTGT